MSELQHPDARNFEDVAELYERVRPSYPDDAVAWLAQQLHIDRHTTILDLGAGTGKLTHAFLGRAGRIIAVEPGPEMLAQLRLVVPEAEAIVGAAEAIPLPDDSVDAIVCGQSFHWFRTDEALREIRRVLRAGSGLGLIWNVRDQKDPLQKEISSLLEPFVPPGRPSIRASVGAFIERTFDAFATYTIPFAQQLDGDALVERIESISFVAAAPDSKQRELEVALRALANAGGRRFAFRYVTEAYAIPNVV